MRPQQQNRRMRGRNGGGGNNNNNNNNNNRRGPNPLTRNYESNGPDVKIRGSAQQIAEKYATLARDAQSSGDRVMAENYLQHAEHYNRIIAAAQAQFASQQPQAVRDDLDEDLDDASFGFDGGVNGNADNYQQAPAQQQAPQQQQQPQQHQPMNGSGPQPVIEGVPAEVALNSEPAGQPTGGGRHRDRRHQHNRHNGMNGGSAHAANANAEEAPAPAPQPEQAPEPAAPAVAATDEAPAAEEQPRPRRGRRPRRGERTQDAEGSAQGELIAAPEGTGEAAAPVES
ncbi:DUF4167 domain-containing protein [Mesorhizobium sp. LHD-90]|uniref:DUF4167 domain-containing protein n=1 Tax=Mesorhizobium sp. LHD-90 TaxID=3071414 RepID=UPI0027E1C33B|nr:DUF4167 domain-containing protein [Mesorhizobium sp. LHD-90]MDQ6432820.1 DUF4167 domain-containing protein [Mesorhizobium sp. LHD-90]